jgi:hypothetical protein
MIVPSGDVWIATGVRALFGSPVIYGNHTDMNSVVVSMIYQQLTMLKIMVFLALASLYFFRLQLPNKALFGSMCFILTTVTSNV